jgi:hypothetical protein
MTYENPSWRLWRNRLWAAGVLLIGAAPLGAVRQVSPVSVDGHCAEIDRLDSVSQVNAPHSSGSRQSDLLHLRVANDDHFLYLGLACRLPDPPTSSGVLILLDGRPGGGNLLPAFSRNPSPVWDAAVGTRLETGFGADLALTISPNPGRSYEVHLVDLSTSQVHSLGLLQSGSRPVKLLPSGLGPSPALQVAWDPGETAEVEQAAQAVRGLEVALPLAWLDGDSQGQPGQDRPVQVFAASIQVEGSAWSNHTLPPSIRPGDGEPIGGGNGLRPPDFAANTRGDRESPSRSATPPSQQQAAPPALSLVGHQGLSAALPVVLTDFHLE